MSKYSTIEIWNQKFGNKAEVFDYAGRPMKKSACGNPNSRYFPTIDHIRPLSHGGSDILENIIICHRDTNVEKSNSFPHWKANGNRYIAYRVRGKKMHTRFRDKGEYNQIDALIMSLENTKI